MLARVFLFWRIAQRFGIRCARSQGVENLGECCPGQMKVLLYLRGVRVPDGEHNELGHVATQPVIRSEDDILYLEHCGASS